jgi:hypothetical protein
MLDKLDLALGEKPVVKLLNQLFIGLRLDQSEQMDCVKGSRGLGFLVKLANH